MSSTAPPLVAKGSKSGQSGDTYEYKYKPKIQIQIKIQIQAENTNTKYNQEMAKPGWPPLVAKAANQGNQAIHTSYNTPNHGPTFIPSIFLSKS